jgi:hypothetical protein
MTELGEASLAGALLDALKDKHTPIRCEAARGLIKLRDPASLTKMFQTLQGSDLEVWREALTAIKSWGADAGADALPTLFAALRSPAPDFQEFAARTIVSIDPTLRAKVAQALDRAGNYTLALAFGNAEESDGPRRR